MKRILAVLAAALLPLACGEPTAPSTLHSSYFLSTLDGKPLPVNYPPDGSMLLSSRLDFGDLQRPRTVAPSSGTVRYLEDIRRPDQSVDHSEVDLDYTISEGVLRINLCPPLALCIASVELAGPINDGDELLLTYYLSGQPGSLYRFVAIRPD